MKLKLKWGHTCVLDCLMRVTTESPSVFGITLKGWPIKRVFEFKNLGVVFDEHISWNSHVKYVLSQAGKWLGMLGLTSDCANSIYTAYFCPFMDYCDTVWNCCRIGNSLSLERLQRRAAKIVSKMSNSDRALDYLQWPSLVNRQVSAMLMNSSKDALKDNARNFIKTILLSKVLSTIKLQGKWTCYTCQGLELT